MENMWQFDTWRTDKDIIFNTGIVEYDLKSAGLSVAREFKLLPENYIKKLAKADKKERVVSLGLYKRDHPQYSADEKAGLASARQLFFDANHLEPNDIVAIKKDAIFVIDKGRDIQTKFGKYLEFRPKNRYTGYMFIKPLEIFYNEGLEVSTLDIKGMSPDKYQLHKDYFGQFIIGIFKLAENEVASKHFILKYIRDIYDKYRLKELDYEFYRQFNATSQYVTKDGVSYDIEVADLDTIDCGYNAQVIISILMAVLNM